MTYVTQEIASQPACWAAAIELSAESAGLLPAPGERVAVVGCGTSYNMALAYACLREDAGRGLTDAMPASEMRTWREYDRFVFLSRSGTTTEVLEALKQVPPGIPTTAITADAGSPLAAAAKSTIVLDFAGERSVVQTRFATSVLVLLRAHLGEDVGLLPDQAKLALEASLPGRSATPSAFTFWAGAGP